MTLLEQIEQYAHDKGIEVIQTSTVGIPAYSANFMGKSFVFVDYNRITTDRGRVDVLAHEIAHIEADALNSGHTHYVPPSKLEHQADVRVIRGMLPQCVLEDAVTACDGRLWEVAEELGVSESLVRKALKYYESKRD